METAPLRDKDWSHLGHMIEWNPFGFTTPSKLDRCSSGVHVFSVLARRRYKGVGAMGDRLWSKRNMLMAWRRGGQRMERHQA